MTAKDKQWPIHELWSQYEKLSQSDLVSEFIAILENAYLVPWAASFKL